jgi:hypothetical protein
MHQDYEYYRSLDFPGRRPLRGLHMSSHGLGPMVTLSEISVVDDVAGLSQWQKP